MKKVLFILGASLLTAVAANAQKTVIKSESYSNTQARSVEVTGKGYVRPLVVDLKVPQGQKRMKYLGPRDASGERRGYERTLVEVGMEGVLDNLRSRVLYDACEEWNCDAIVAATFKIELSKDGRYYEVEMKGFPANFEPSSWHSLGERPEDYKWLEADMRVSLDKANDPDRAGAVIRNIKK